MNQTTESNSIVSVSAKSGPALPGNWAAFQQLTCRLDLEIPVPGFTIAALLRLTVNDVVNSHWLQGSDIPLHVNGKLIGWSEFEVIEERLAARLTQIA
jgi:flagellar motor switch protein FliN/FliY